MGGQNFTKLIYENIKQKIIDKYENLFIVDKLLNDYNYYYDDIYQYIYIDKMRISVIYDKNAIIANINLFILEPSFNLANFIKKSNIIYECTKENDLYISFNYTEVDKLLNLVDSIYNFINNKKLY
jgi:type IV secretory pathway TraG/TraD family ATPase VirD4